MLMENISEFILVNQVRDMKAEIKDEALVELCNMVSDNPAVTDPDDFLTAIRDREKIMSTGIGTGIALPHTRITSLKDFVIAVGRSKKGIDYESLDGLPVNIFVILGAPERKRREFLKLIAGIGKIFEKPGFNKKFMDAETSEDMFELLVKSFK